VQDCAGNEAENGSVKGVNPVSPPLIIILPPSPNQQPDNNGSTLGGIAYRERKLLDEDPFLRKTTEQRTGNRLPLRTRIQEATGFPLKNESS
jgi:hypothetical protein